MTFASADASVQHYVAQAIDSTGVPLAAAFTLAETGVGAEVFGTGTPTLVFTTDAAGAATITITDVAGASSKTMLLLIRPLHESAEARIAVPAGVEVEFVVRRFF